jgi:hypothetical protein
VGGGLIKLTSATNNSKSSNNDTLRAALLNKLSNFRETAPLFRIRQRSIDEMEKVAVDFGNRFVATYSKNEPRRHVSRHEGFSVIHLPEGARMRVFHSSGAIIAKQSISPMDKIITRTTNKEELTRQAIEISKKLGVDGLVTTQNERIEFERLWQIKATGISNGGQKGQEVLCRIIGAFRRYLDNLPVFGRASIYVELAEDNIVDSFGIDWRPIIEEAIDNVKIIDPETAADRVIGELGVVLPGGIITSKNYEPQLFSLGYFSFAKRRPQTFMQPVYVAMFKARGSTTLSRLIVVPATHSPYEPISRILESNPSQPVKPKPTKGYNPKQTEFAGRETP